MIEHDGAYATTERGADDWKRIIHSSGSEPRGKFVELWIEPKQLVKLQNHCRHTGSTQELAINKLIEENL